MRSALAWVVVAGVVGVGAAAAAACSSDDTIPPSKFSGSPTGTTTPTATPPDAPSGYDAPPRTPPLPGIDAGEPSVDAAGTDSAIFIRPLDCPTSPCGTNQECCAVPDDAGLLTLECLTSCPASQFPVSCDGRDQCRAQGKLYCCALLQLGEGAEPHCPYVSGYSSCTDTCMTNFAQNCGDNTSVKPCHAASDCANDQSGQTNCCNFGPGALLTFCVDDAQKGDAGCL